MAWFDKEKCTICDGPMCTRYDELRDEKKGQREATRIMEAETIVNGQPIYTAEQIRARVNYLKGEKKSGRNSTKDSKSNNVFNETNEMVGWARWTWNPLTGCLQGCKYCYARDIANRFYKEKFEPTFRPHRLVQPKTTELPKQKGWHRRVFVCSMGELFGEWVEQEHIDKILNAAAGSPDWTFIYLTKNPERLLAIKWPENSWVGATVDNQERANRVEPIFEQLNGPHKFYSIEPFTEPIQFRNLTNVDRILIGGRSRSSGMPAKYPDGKILGRLLIQAHEAEIKWFIKSNVNKPT